MKSKHVWFNLSTNGDKFLEVGRQKPGAEETDRSLDKNELFTYTLPIDEKPTQSYRYKEANGLTVLDAVLLRVFTPTVKTIKL